MFWYRRTFLSAALSLAIASAGVTAHPSISDPSPSRRIEVEQALGTQFAASDVVRLDADAARHERRLTIRSAERSFDVALVPNDMRAASYRAENVTADGAVLPLADAGPVHTFKGTVAGGGTARFSIDGDSLEGMILVGHESYYVEPARRYAKKAAADEFVVYEASDVLRRDSGTCATLDERVDRAASKFASTSAPAYAGLREIEVATEADYEYVTAEGGAAKANRTILAVMNEVEGLYERDLRLTFRVTFQHTWETAADPYEAPSISALLGEFSTYWNANFTYVQRDLAHIWTARPRGGTPVGIAYLSVACSIPSLSYAVSWRYEFTDLRTNLTAHEIGHNLGANHSNGVAGCDVDVMRATLVAIASYFCQFSRDEINAHLASNSGCLSTHRRPRLDFDGDTLADVALFRPSGGDWYVRGSAAGTDFGAHFGQYGDRIVPEDYDGDDVTDFAVYRDGVWYVLNTANQSVASYQFGLATDVPVPADLDGDTRAELVVFRPSTGAWYAYKTLDGSVTEYALGQTGDVPVPADYDGDRHADPAVFRPSTGVWIILSSVSASTIEIPFGTAEDRPAPADYDGDSKADLAVYRGDEGMWYVLRSGDGGVSYVPFGLVKDRPVPADYDGDGRADVAVFRPSTGTWYVLPSDGGDVRILAYGLRTDVPAAAAYVP